MSKSLMIVDDSATMRKIIIRTLQTAGFGRCKQQVLTSARPKKPATVTRRLRN